MQEVRCTKCDKLLCKTDLAHKELESDQEVKCVYTVPKTNFVVEAKCTRCGTMNKKVIEHQ
jgi:phage FluMu protein Com